MIVEEILPGTPEWDESERALDRQEMAWIVECRTADGQVVDFFGPFEGEDWARAWITQHQNDPTFDLPEDEDPPDSRLDDVDHFCAEAEDSSHYIYPLTAPGFDPGTLPGRI